MLAEFLSVHYLCFKFFVLLLHRLNKHPLQLYALLATSTSPLKWNFEWVAHAFSRKFSTWKRALTVQQLHYFLGHRSITTVNAQLLKDSYSFFFKVLILNITKFTEMLLTNRFYVDACLFSNRSQIMSKCGKNMKVVHELQSLIF